MWEPILVGEDADRAVQVVHEVARALDGAPVPRYAEASLAEGHAGLALFHAEVGDRARAEAALDRALELTGEDEDVWASLHHGACGVALAVTLLERRYGAQGEDPLAELDAVLARDLARDGRREVDLMRGVAGVGLYALERPAARRVAELAVAALEAGADEDARGLFWYTEPELQSDRSRAEEPLRTVGLGVAHGVAGIITFLARAHAAGIEEGRCARLLDRAVPWLLAARLPSGAPSIFPGSLRPGREPEPSRPTWCAGDPGIALALLAAARASGDERWAAAGRDTALAVARRAPETCGIVDAGLCHGAAGLSHLLHCLHDELGEPPLADAAAGWARRALALRAPGRGIAGFRAYSGHGNDPWRDDPGLLIGAAGVALALLAATGAPPSWDGALALSRSRCSSGTRRSEPSRPSSS